MEWEFLLDVVLGEGAGPNTLRSHSATLRILAACAAANDAAHAAASRKDWREAMEQVRIGAMRAKKLDPELREELREIYASASAEAIGDLAEVAMYRAHAIDARLTGRIADALRFERRAEEIRNMLPAELRAAY